MVPDVAAYREPDQAPAGATGPAPRRPPPWPSASPASSTFRAWEYWVSTPRVGLRRRIARVFQTSLVEVDQWFNKRSAAPDGLQVPDWLGHFATLEQGASQLWSYEAIAVPGLPHTAAYAAAVVSIRPETISEADVARNVEIRLARQAARTRQPEPLRLSVIIDESVVHREAGGPDIMAAQLHHLIDATDAPNVELRVPATHRRDIPVR